MKKYICPSCHKIFDNSGVCQQCQEKLILLEEYLNIYEKKIQQKISAAESMLIELEEVYKNASKQKLRA